MTEATTLPENPLLAPTGIPAYPDFRPDHVEPGVEALLAELADSLERLEQEAPATWAGVVEEFERISDRLRFVWGLVSHLMNVRNTPELREVHDRMQPRIVELRMKIGQSRAVFDKLEALRNGPEWEGLDEGQRRTVEALLHDARLAGVGLEGKTKERFNQLQQELAELGTRFANNVLDATKAFHLDLKDPEEVEGLPPSLLGLAAQASGEEGATAETGPWRITLDFPSYLPFMRHSRRRDLREQLYKVYTTRASSGETDNTEIVRETLRKRREMAKLLGYGSWAEVSLSNKMAPDVGAVRELLGQLLERGRPAAERDLAEMFECARAAGATDFQAASDLEPWDSGFWSERLREQRFAFTQEELRPYFPLERVLTGLFELATRLFDVRLEDASDQVRGWHSDVRYYVLRDAGGAPRASFFLDPFARSEDKRGGAWMDDCLGRSRLFPTADGQPRLPVAYVVCNFTPPVGGKPSLLTFDEVETLFHEFGHAMQHMMTRVEHGLVSGIGNVEWDAVELPSQFMENWCYHEPTLTGLTAHVETGEPLPRELFEKISAARTFQSGTGTLRQLFFALTDLDLHDTYDPEGSETPVEVQERVADATLVGKRYTEGRPLCSFAHIFAGGYAAGYYSYKWAEVLSADAFAAFEEVGLEDEDAVADTGRRFAETVLGLGGSRPPMEVFKDFRGREPKTDALLRHCGLA